MSEYQWVMKELAEGEAVQLVLGWLIVRDKINGCLLCLIVVLGKMMNTK
jgi:hypothetical protein